MVNIRPSTFALFIVKLQKNLQQKQQRFQLPSQVILKCAVLYLYCSLKLKPNMINIELLTFDSFFCQSLEK